MKNKIIKKLDNLWFSFGDCEETLSYRFLDHCVMFVDDGFHVRKKPKSGNMLILTIVEDGKVKYTEEIFGSYKYMLEFLESYTFRK